MNYVEEWKWKPGAARTNIQIVRAISSDNKFVRVYIVGCYSPFVRVSILLLRLSFTFTPSPTRNVICCAVSCAICSGFWTYSLSRQPSIARELFDSGCSSWTQLKWYMWAFVDRAKQKTSFSPPMSFVQSQASCTKVCNVIMNGAMKCAFTGCSAGGWITSRK